MVRFNLLMVLIMLSPGLLFAREVEVHLSKKSVTVGEPVQVRFILDQPKDRKIEVQEPPREYTPPQPQGKEIDKDQPGSFIPLYRVIRFARDSQHNAELIMVMDLAFYRTGTWEVPGPLVTLDGSAVKYQRPVITVKETNQQGGLADIEPPLDLGGNYTRLILLIVGVVIVTALVILLVYLWRRRKDRVPEVVQVDPWQFFHDELNQLSPETKLQEGQFELYATGMSMLFRRFLSILYQVDLVELTTDEIRQLVQSRLSTQVSARYRDQLVRFMELWDLVKFAEFTPGRELMEDNLREARQLVDKMQRAHGTDDL